MFKSLDDKILLSIIDSAKIQEFKKNEIVIH
jgi:hypothetical protein